MNQSTSLKNFNSNELFLNEEETRIILKFFYSSDSLSTQIDQMTISDPAREFAQGMLIEAIERSYQMGFLQSLFRASSNPSSGAVQVIKKFALRASRHWFRHASKKDLVNVQIYDMIRDRLASNFRFHMLMLLQGIANVVILPPVAIVSYPPLQHIEMVWG